MRIVSGLKIGVLLRLAASLVAFALGVWGFYEVYRPQDPTGAHLLDDAFKALQLVIGHFPSELDGKPLPAPLHIARWTLPLLAGWTTASLAWIELRNTVRLKWIALKGDQLVIAGDETLAAQVAARALQAKRRVILWVADARDRWVQDAADHGAPHVPLGADTKALRALGLGKARSVLIGGPDDAGNLNLAVKVVEVAAHLRAPGDPLEVIARVDDIDLQAPLERRLQSGALGREGARLRFASIPNITARAFFLGQSLDRFSRPGGGKRLILLLGFSPIAERLVLRLMVGAHFRDGVAPTFVALDPDAATKQTTFRARHPGAAAMQVLTFEQAPMDQPSLIEGVLSGVVERHGQPALMVVDPADPARALSIAVAAANVFHKHGWPCPPVHAHMAHEAEPGLSASLFAFGGADRLATPELLLQEDIDDLARAVHEFYLEGQLDRGAQIGSQLSMHEWAALPESVREDNRMVADCYALKLKDIGARLVPGAGEGLQFEGDELEQLARAEHERWMAAKLVDGWSFAETRDDAAKHHPNILGYDALSEPIKELDREQIRIMARLIGRAGQRVARDLVVALDPGGLASGAFAAGVVAALTELARRYPGRAIVLLGSFEDAAVRAGMLAAEPAGAFIQLTLAANVDVAIDRLAPADRATAIRLYRGADRWFSVPVESQGAFVLSRADVRIARTGAPPASLATLWLDASGGLSSLP